MNERSFSCLASGDVTLESYDGHTYGGHRIVLSAASGALKSLLGDAFKEGQQIQQGQPIEIAASGDVVAALLDHIYGGEPDISRTDATELLRLAGAYELPRLVAEIESDSCLKPLPKWPYTNELQKQKLQQVEAKVSASKSATEGGICKTFKFSSATHSSAGEILVHSHVSSKDSWGLCSDGLCRSEQFSILGSFARMLFWNSWAPFARCMQRLGDDGVTHVYVPGSVAAKTEELRSCMDTTMALHLLPQIHLLGRTSLRQACEDQVADDFEKCVNLADFTKLNSAQLARMLARDDLWVTREEVVLQGLFKWTKASTERQSQMGMLLQHIDFRSLSARNLKQLGLFAQSMGQHGFELQYSAEEALRAKRTEFCGSGLSFYAPEAKRRCLRHVSPELGAFPNSYAWGQWIAGELRTGGYLVNIQHSSTGYHES